MAFQTPLRYACIVALAGLVFLLATGIFLPMWDLYKVALH